MNLKKELVDRSGKLLGRMRRDFEDAALEIEYLRAELALDLEPVESRERTTRVRRLVERIHANRLDDDEGLLTDN